MNNNKTLKDNKIPELNTMAANQLLDNVFAACDVAPNAIPLEALESWGNYKKTEFRRGRLASYIALVLIVLMPLAFFKPTIIAQRTNVESNKNAVYNIQVKNLLPVKATSATLNGTPVPLQKTNSKNFMAEVKENGTLVISTVSFNGQRAVQSYEVSHVDTDKPVLINSYTEDNKIYLIVRDAYSGIDYKNITGTDSENQPVKPLSYDQNTETIIFTIPEQPVTISIPDKSGNVLQLLLSPTK